MTLRLDTAPAEDPVTLAEVKAHLNIGHTDDDDLLAEYIDAAVAFVLDHVRGASAEWDAAADVLHSQPTTRPAGHGGVGIGVLLPVVGGLTLLLHAARRRARAHLL